MDLKKYTRDASKVHERLVTTKDGSLVAPVGCKIYIPERFTEKQLAVLGTEVHTVGFFAIVVEDKWYGVSKAPAMMKIDPTSTDTVMVDGEPYLEFTFEPGATITANVNLVKNDTIVYLLYDEILAKGHPPKFMDYEDLANMFLLSPYHAGLEIGGDHNVMEMFAAFVCRDPDDKTKYYRQTLTDREQIRTRPPVAIPFRSVSFGATNTMAKLMGNYFEEGSISALNNPSTGAIENLDRMLRT